MGWFGGSSSSEGDTGFQSKKRSPDYSLGTSEELDLSDASPLGGGGATQDFGNMSDADIQQKVMKMQQQAQLAQGVRTLFSFATGVLGVSFLFLGRLSSMRPLLSIDHYTKIYV